MDLTLDRRADDGGVGLLDHVTALGPSVGVRRIEDPDEMQYWVAQHWATTRRELCSTLPAGPYPLEVLQRSWKDDTELIARGVVARAIYQSDAVRTPAMMQYLSDLASVGGNVRVARRTNHRIMIFDRRVAFVATARDTLLLPYLMITESALVQSVCQQFAAMWRVAHSIGITNEDVLDFERVREILEVLATGATDDATARKLGVSDRTVRRRVAAVMDLLDASSRFEAGVKAVQAGWL